MTAAVNILKFHFQSIFRAPQICDKKCCIKPSFEISSEISVIINQTPCRGGQCLNIGDQRESQRHPQVSLSDQLTTTTAGWSQTPQADRRMMCGFIDHTHTASLACIHNATFSTKESISISYVYLFISQHRGQGLAFSGSWTSCRRLFPSPPSREPAPRGDPPRYRSALLHLQVEFFNVKIKIPFFTFC